MNPTSFDNCLTPLDQKLQQLATSDWQRFVLLVGLSSITKAKICLLRSEDKSLSSIANRLRITKRKAQVHAKKCNC
jgi:hypothetical protein